MYASVSYDAWDGGCKRDGHLSPKCLNCLLPGHSARSDIDQQSAMKRVLLAHEQVDNFPKNIVLVTPI